MRFTGWQVITLLCLIAGLLAQGCEHIQPVSPGGDGGDGSGLQLSDFRSAAECARCHPDHVREWSGSMHAYAAVDPIFVSMQKLGQLDTNEKMDQFCAQCHTPIASQLGFTPANYDNSDLPPFALEGVTCAVCHNVSELEEAQNAKLIFDPAEGMRGGIEQPVSNTFHKSLYDPLQKSSDLCGACHSVTNARGVRTQNTYAEWQESPAAAAGKTCASCHMPSYRGSAVAGAPERELHRHRFVGVDVAVIDFPEREEQARLVRELLESSAEMRVEVAESINAGGYLPITVHVTSKTEGHRLPSGSTSNRQMWLEVTLEDLGKAETLYASGHLDANQDLMDRHSQLMPSADQDLRLWTQKMAGEGGRDAFFSWQAVSERTLSIAPLQTVSPAYDQIIPTDVTGPLRLTVRLRFRSFAPFILRILDEQDRLEQLPIIDMATFSQNITLL